MGKVSIKMKELYPGNYDTETFDPQIINIRTGKKGKGRTHHCPECDSAATAACYTKLHFAYCRTKIVVGVDEQGNDILEICGHRYAPKSPNGCGTHKFPEHNQYVKNIYKGASPYETYDDSVLVDEMAGLSVVDEESKTL